MQKHSKNELHAVFSGKSQVSQGAAIQAVACYLGNGAPTGPEIKGTKHFKSEETKRLEHYISQNQLWLNDIDLSQYVSEGAEQKVYLKDAEYVRKLNDAIYYTCWQDYFYNLLLHNFFFSDTAYTLIGFTAIEGVLHAVVEQSFVEMTEHTDLTLVKKFLELNGFENKRNNDYFNPHLGIILEDLHDENVLSSNDYLYFIDTVFYITPFFWIT